jgi:hypothetical protein
MEQAVTIFKRPVLDEGQDYAILRTKGLEYIEELGSKYWTDYNIHDPGITLLELLCYAITDLGYRASMPVKDLLAEGFQENPNPERQAFFPAHEILTINPWTTEDFRKTLIDIEGIKNAWLKCKECPCDDLYLYVKCIDSKLQYEPTPHPVTIKGMYDVLVEFEDAERLGDLNSGKIRYNFHFAGAEGFTTAVIEMRLPSWHQLEEERAKYKKFRTAGTTITGVTVDYIAGNKSDNLNIPDAQVAKILRRQVFVTMKVKYKSGGVGVEETLDLEDIPMNIWFHSDSDRKVVTLAVISNAIEDYSQSGILPKYLSKINEADEVIAEARMKLHDTRNLCEDYCSVKAVQVQDIAICADIEVEPSVDIEAITAEAFNVIDQYFSPDIRFYSLKELLDKGVAIEDIFEGPALTNGFIDNEQLASTNLKQFVYASDIINLLMDIPGIKAVRNFSFSAYDDDGRAGATKAWTIAVAYNHQPRLYVEASKFLVFKNELPFLPDRSELYDTLEVIKARNVQPKYPGMENTLRFPKGTWSDLTEYYPLQYSLPLTYGVGMDGIPGLVTEERIAQAKQLKAYLMFFEQMLVNYLQQLANIKELFAVDSNVTQTYFSRLLTNKEIEGVEDLYKDLDAGLLQELSENNSGFLDRRNRLLDHLLSRFAEQFNDYALMLYSYQQEKTIADEQLIKNKVEFIKDFPVMSSNRGKAFNYKDPALVCDNENVAGLKLRIERLLGISQFEDHFELYEESDTDGVSHERRWRLKDENGKIYLSSSTRYVDVTLDAANEKAMLEIREVRKYITDINRYEIKEGIKFTVNLLDTTGEVIATRKQPFATRELAEAAVAEIIEYGRRILAEEKIFIVEHILLRPNKQTAEYPYTDPLLSICVPDDCDFCGEDDPYSHRFTIVMNGEEGLANSGIDFRRFAEKTIREQAPAHLGLKICWVSSEQLIEFEKRWCAFLKEKAKAETDAAELNTKLVALLSAFENLKSVYPDAYLHDCEDGDDQNRVFLDQTII